MSLLFCPMPFLYAAIRMDPVAMVEHLQDPIALAAARKLQPKTYLVYIEAQLELPFPGKPWYRFCVCPIGTSLRPEDKVHDLTPEMCIAIHPNKFHPTGRSPVIPEPSFPYDNCYHWIGFAIYIRVRARSEQFEHERAVRLPPEERTTMELHWEDDDDRRDVASDGSSSGCSEPGDAVSILSRAATSTSSSESSIEPDTGDTAGDILAEMNIFGDPMHDVELFPLVDLWFELTEHLKQEDIPDPMELYKERDEIVRIIEEARSRANTAYNTSLASKTDSIYDDICDNGAPKEAKPTATARMHTEALLQNFQWKCRHIMGGVRRIFRMPYIPIWP